MQIAAVTLNDQQRRLDNKLDSYLDCIGWDTKEFSNEKLEAMLAASCLRFLEGLTDISFVVGLAEKILKKKKDELNISLHYATEILTTLSEKLSNHKISITDKHTINTYVDDAQEVITSRRYFHTVS